MTDMSAWEQAVTPATRMFFLETPSNPMTDIADLAALAELAHLHDCSLVVDNCLCTPVLQRPLEHGADVVVHSATKFLDGQGRCLGGAIIGTRELLEDRLVPFLRSAGPCMSPFNAWVFLKGLETLQIRMERHSRNALAVANWLLEQDQVKAVHYPGLGSHPQHELACRQQSDFGGIVSFEVLDRQAAWHIVDNLKHFSITANLGDTKSIVTHPATTTHGRLSSPERELMRVGEGLLRLSVGLEDVNDLIGDLDRAMNSSVS